MTTAVHPAAGSIRLVLFARQSAPDQLTGNHPAHAPFASLGIRIGRAWLLLLARVLLRAGRWGRVEERCGLAALLMRVHRVPSGWVRGLSGRDRLKVASYTLRLVASCGDDGCTALISRWTTDTDTDAIRFTRFAVSRFTREHDHRLCSRPGPRLPPVEQHPPTWRWR
jgi:hypothetical protein